jgi:hypothetical protein
MRGLGRAVVAGMAYAFAIFLVGSAVGVVRVLALEPRYGKLDATIFELPLMLGLAWLISASLVHRCAVSGRAGDRLMMGGIAFLLLIAAELGFASLLGRTPHYDEPAAFLGLAGQVAAALVPLSQACFFRRDIRALPYRSSTSRIRAIASRRFRSPSIRCSRCFNWVARSA